MAPIHSSNFAAPAQNWSLIELRHYMLEQQLFLFHFEHFDHPVESIFWCISAILWIFDEIFDWKRCKLLDSRLNLRKSVRSLQKFLPLKLLNQEKKDEFESPNNKENKRRRKLLAFWWFPDVFSELTDLWSYNSHYLSEVHCLTKVFAQLLNKLFQSPTMAENKKFRIQRTVGIQS